MGTFHHDTHELHGITVVVDTVREEIYIGRCENLDDRGIVLVDVDVHRDGDGGQSQRDYLRRAARFGVWATIARAVIPQAEVRSIRPLGEIPVDDPGALG